MGSLLSRLDDHNKSVLNTLIEEDFEKLPTLGSFLAQPEESEEPEIGDDIVTYDVSNGEQTITVEAGQIVEIVSTTWPETMVDSKCCSRCQ